MNSQVPVLDAEGVVEISERHTFVEVMDAVIDGQWIMIAPKVKMQLQKDVTFNVVYGPDQTTVGVIGTPYYWRGPFVGLRVRPATGSALQSARDASLRLRAEAEQAAADNVAELRAEAEQVAEAPAEALPELPEPPSLPVDEAFAPVAPPQLEETGSSPEADPDSGEFTETDYIDFNAIVAKVEQDSPAEAGGDAPETTPAADSKPGQAGHATMAVRPVERATTPTRAAAAPGPVDTGSAVADLRGRTGGPFSEKELLTPFPGKGQGLPLPEGASLYRVLAVLAAQEASGQLSLKHGDQTAEVFLRKGTLLGVEPLGDSFDKQFADFLLKDKAIEQGPLDQAIAHAQAFDKTLPVALYEKRAIGMDVMGRTLRELKQSIFFDLLAFDNPLTFQFAARRKFGRKFDPMRLHLAGTLVEFIRSQLKGKYLADLEPLLADYKFKYVQMAESDLIPLDVLGLDDKQRHGVKHVFHGPNRLNETYSLCLLTRHGTARLITLLHHFGLIKWLDEPGEVAGSETIEQRLSMTMREMEAQDLFQRLEVHWGAHPRKIDAALKRFTEKFGPDTPLARNSDEAQKICARIMSLVQEAYDRLSNKRQRREYRLEKQGDMRIKRAAEFLVKQADLVRFRGDWDEAFDLIEAALDMWEHPQIVSKYNQWRAERGGRR